MTAARFKRAAVVARVGSIPWAGNCAGVGPMAGNNLAGRTQEVYNSSSHRSVCLHKLC